MWSSTKTACLAVLLDGLFFMVCLFALTVADFILPYLHIGEWRAELLEDLHFNAIYACLLIMSAETITRLILHAKEKLECMKAFAD